jgi:hypothetical protein
MALPLCDSSEAVERAAATISQTRSSGSDAVVAGSLVQAWSRIGRYEAVVQTTWKALESGGWEHQGASRALTAALKYALGLTDQAISSSNHRDATRFKQKATVKPQKKTKKKDWKVAEHRWRDAQLLFSALQRAGLADGFQ